METAGEGQTGGRTQREAFAEGYKCMLLMLGFELKLTSPEVVCNFFFLLLSIPTLNQSKMCAVFPHKSNDG